MNRFGATVICISLLGFSANSWGEEPAPASSAGANTAAAGQIIQDAPGLPELVVIPAGKLKSTVVKSVAFGRYPVTLAQYKLYFAEKGLQLDGDWCDGRTAKGWEVMEFSSFKAPGFPQDDDHPVVCVSEMDAIGYTEWLSAKTGKVYRLPTSEEWEYAARGGVTNSNWWGSDLTKVCEFANGADSANFPSSPGAAKCVDGFGYTSPVGRFKPNAFGLFDMLGNVQVWTASKSPKSALAYIIRGSSWLQGPAAMTFNHKEDSDILARYYITGMRVVRELGDEHE